MSRRRFSSLATRRFRRRVSVILRPEHAEGARERSADLFHFAGTDVPLQDGDNREDGSIRIAPADGIKLGTNALLKTVRAKFLRFAAWSIGFEKHPAYEQWQLRREVEHLFNGEAVTKGKENAPEGVVRCGFACVSHQLSDFV